MICSVHQGVRGEGHIQGRVHARSTLPDPVAQMVNIRLCTASSDRSEYNNLFDIINEIVST